MICLCLYFLLFHFCFINLFLLQLNNQLYEKQELEEEPREEKTTVVTKNEEEQLENQNIQNPQLAKGEPPEPEPFQSNVLQSDIQWGHKTFQKLLNSLRLL